jgi:hypothetical protein
MHSRDRSRTPKEALNEFAISILDWVSLELQSWPRVAGQKTSLDTSMGCEKLVFRNDRIWHLAADHILIGDGRFRCEADMHRCHGRIASGAHALNRLKQVH